MTLKAYQTDYLLLLVGGNPLPVYVSTMQLATAKTKVKLLYSTPQNGSRHTTSLSKYLKEVIEKKIGCDVELFDIPSADRQNIILRLETLVNTFPSQATVGINYTGGTKQMVVHTLDVLARKYGSKLVRSYLNAQDKQLYIDKGNTYLNPYPVQTGNKVTLEDLLLLHNYECKQPLSTEANHHLLANALLSVHQTDDGIQAWYEWRRNEYHNDSTLPNADKYPDLKPIIQAMHEVCHGEPTPEKIANYLGCKNGQFKSCAKWFKGEWLEEWVLHEVLAISDRLGLHDVGSGLEIQPRDNESQSLKAEIDVVTMKNYQLFALSCIASSNKKRRGETKKHLFEAYTRARQLGGDEARVALVYLGKERQTLQEEINRDWLVSDAIVVFGRNELENFQSELYHWFRRNS